MRLSGSLSAVSGSPAGCEVTRSCSDDPLDAVADMVHSLKVEQRTRERDLIQVACARQELLQLLVIDTETSSHRLHRLTLPIQHQPTQIPNPCLPLIDPRQAREHPGRKLLKLLPNPRQPTLIHTRSQASSPSDYERHTTTI